MAAPTLSTVSITEAAPGVLHIALNRPDRSNAMNKAMWAEIGQAFRFAALHPCRVVLLTGAGKNFTSGLDLMDHVDLFAPASGGQEDAARRAFRLRDHIKAYQASFTAVEECPKPVIAAVHGACIGGGVDLVAAADVRFASGDAWFCIKEAEIGLAADVGTLQRLPKVVGNDSLVREWAYTARRITAEEAQKAGMLR
jgi:delta(3,5)-delta(2,4)-dienoyl-CoA isomerase